MKKDFEVVGGVNAVARRPGPLVCPSLRSPEDFITIRLTCMQPLFGRTHSEGLHAVKLSQSILTCSCTLTFISELQLVAHPCSMIRVEQDRNPCTWRSLPVHEFLSCSTPIRKSNYHSSKSHGCIALTRSRKEGMEGCNFHMFHVTREGRSSMTAQTVLCEMAWLSPSSPASHEPENDINSSSCVVFEQTRIVFTTMCC